LEIAGRNSDTHMRYTQRSMEDEKIAKRKLEELETELFYQKQNSKSKLFKVEARAPLFTRDVGVNTNIESEHIAESTRSEEVRLPRVINHNIKQDCKVN